MDGSFLDKNDNIELGKKRSQQTEKGLGIVYRAVINYQGTTDSR